VEEKNKILYYDDRKNYEKFPEKPNLIIEFDNNDTVITSYYFSGKNDEYRISEKRYYADGILMKSEDYYYPWDTEPYWETDIYTVSSGIGEVIETYSNNDVTNRRFLERKINKEGFLEYQAVWSEKGGGTEWFFTKDIGDNNNPDGLSYEEALEKYDRVIPENIVLEKITINGETYTIIDVYNTEFNVGTDSVTEIYDIPDKSGNVLFTIPYKEKMKATLIALIEEPSMADWGGGYEHWAKIKLENGIVGWVRGEYLNMDKGGRKYRPK